MARSRRIILVLTFGSVLLTVIGWGGALCALTAYFMVTKRLIEPDSMLYQGLNLGGAFTLCISASVSGAWPSAIVNLICVGIGLQAVLTAKQHVLKALLRRRERAGLARLRQRAGRGPVPVESPARSAHAPLVLR